MKAGQTNQKRKFNILDFVIVILMVAVIGVLVWYIGSRGDASAKSGTVRYLIEINNVNPAVKDSAQVGDTVIDALSKSVIGTIESVNVYPQNVDVYNSLLGEMITVENPLKYRVEIWCSAQAEISDTQVTVNGYQLSVGKVVFMHSKHFAGEGYCLSITRSQEAGTDE